MKPLFFVGSVIAATIMTTAAHAKIVVDQDQPTIGRYGFNTSEAGAPDNNPLSQSFTAGYDNSAGAGAYIKSNNAGTITITLSNDLPGAADYQALASGSVKGSNGWLDVMWAPATVQKGSTYYLTFSTDYYAFAATDFDNSYEGGRVFFPAVPESTPLGLLSNSDLTFRTYAENTVSSPVSAAPEPAAWALMIIGVGIAGVALRRQKGGVRVSYAA